MLGNRTLFPRVGAGMERQNYSNRSDHPILRGLALKHGLGFRFAISLDWFIDESITLRNKGISLELVRISFVGIRCVRIRLYRIGF